GWRGSHQHNSTQVRTMNTAGRALGLAVITLVVGGVVGMLGFRSAGILLVPGFIVAWHGPFGETGGLVAFVVVNVLVPWLVWVGLLVACQRLFPGKRTEV